MNGIFPAYASIACSCRSHDGGSESLTPELDRYRSEALSMVFGISKGYALSVTTTMNRLIIQRFTLRLQFSVVRLNQNALRIRADNLDSISNLDKPNAIHMAVAQSQ